MSINTSDEWQSRLNLGDAIPGEEPSSESTHLFVSLSDLVSENIFYHPCFKNVESILSDVELSSIDAILGEVSMEDHFVATLTERIMQSVKPNHQSVRVALSDADSYELSSLLGGKAEAQEVNPALGLRGVSRYAQTKFSHAFALECQVLKALQQQGVQVEIVVPFVRALSDAAKIIDLLAEQGLPRGLNGLKVLYTVDVPSAALLSERLLHYFDGLVINLENLSQYTLGVDRLSEDLQHLFDPQSEAVIALVDMAVKAANHNSKPVLVVTSGLARYSKIREYILEHAYIQVVVTS
ncbi:MULTISPECIES: putative PEP-binding protein [Vibrio]|uniref:Phosphoenolpyruvate synthase n=1 Tax=Vibrio neptunius TaxID=170651 RepID=A0ABS3A4N5_9VIBR|nr:MULTISPECIES: putative PEP-binding protein [Vibrio]MBN3493128.1 phosphoenolpyruvate synthase [Vibrio neptunius]MBN3515689.1 phosphoenolpyruvate synthase [Vibrio neptunius]MBN3549862.1 phosphoenolpyruvate synthase [Vibrio neptunius]MBN3577994.1 phosphoenolpyruvate synthase [Vibrio neptunius]MCH9871658.1 phosphoenolpyruvate synthase [Vibrio neptunius]